MDILQESKKLVADAFDKYYIERKNKVEFLSHINVPPKPCKMEMTTFVKILDPKYYTKLLV